MNELLIKNISNLIKNLLIYNYKRINYYIKNELELEIEYIYVSEFKKNLLIFPENILEIKELSKETYTQINNINVEFENLLKFVESSINLQLNNFYLK
jgi:hypothetical protein